MQLLKFDENLFVNFSGTKRCLEMKGEVGVKG